MLVSHSHKFIFIKTHKTAGSSIEKWLLPFCEDGIVDTKKFNSHWPAEEVKKMVGDQVWDDYMKICPVRNPWDKMVSLYFWRKRKRSLGFMLRKLFRGEHPIPLERRLSFEDYVKKRRNACNIDRSKVLINGEWPDYFYIRFEHLHDDLAKLGEEIGEDYEQEQLPSEKTGYRENREYRKFYTDETKAIVAKAFKMDIEKFGYTF